MRNDRATLAGPIGDCAVGNHAWEITSAGEAAYTDCGRASTWTLVELTAANLLKASRGKATSDSFLQAILDRNAFEVRTVDEEDA